MSGFGAFSGFGQNNNNNQTAGSTGFGAFGTGTSTNTGFGTPNTGFGSTGFGNTSTFGSATTNAFGAAKPSAFGTPAASGGGLFGNNNATTGNAFGSGTFGSAATTTPAFGSNTTGTGIFGGATSTPFGGSAATTTTSAFGAPAATAITQAGITECQGTGSVAFQAYVEKEPNSSTNQQNSFQNIAFQTPYQKFSMEELRLADYNQGRRFGNASNQPGAFGQTNFGGFGTNNTAFGSTTNTTGGNMFGSVATSSPFGTNTQTNTGFGSNTPANGTGLFGAKPATGGIFGSTQPSGGLFGSASNTGFGATNTNLFNSNASGSLFGQNAAAAKPAFSFANPTNTTSTNTFGTSSTPGLFGNSGAFGGNNQQQPTSTGFGTQSATTNAFGGFGTNNAQSGTTSLFGSTQAKPAGGLFGTPASNTNSTGLFGSAQTAPSTNLFGTSNTAQNSGGLFGSKPATSGTDNLFGSTNNNQSNTGGNMFGSFGNQNQQQSSGLFGGLNNNNNSFQQKPSIFGTSQVGMGNNAFGNSGTQQNSPFGGFNNQSQQQNNSIFGNSNSPFSTQNQQAPQSLTASIGDNTAYGLQSLFSDIAANQVNNPGPIATPLTGNRNSVGPKPAALPLYKLNSGSASRFSTPQRRGFGFSYSAYGSPASTTSTASTPGAFSNALLGTGSFNRTLSKSMSTSSLRRSFNTEDSILAPGAFSASPRNRSLGNTGNVKKLTISKNIKSDLFNPPATQPQVVAPINSVGILKKRVSFDANINTNANLNSNGTTSPVKQVTVATPSSAELGYMRPHSSGNNSNTTFSSSNIESEPVPNSNNQLAIVREEETLDPGDATALELLKDKNPGDYWMSPSKAELESMNRVQRQRVSNLIVGRYGVGSVQFDVPVDLTSINLDDIMDGIVKIEVRQVTVYPDNHKKPQMGKGLNVPSTITLENSWPRKKDRKTPLTDQSGIRLQKHIEKLKKVDDTEFVDYDKTTGTWTFRVPHFTTYGLPDEDEEDEAEDNISQNDDLLTGISNNFNSSFASTSQLSRSEYDPEDTFEFRKSKKILPGTFDSQDVYVDLEDEDVSFEQESFPDDQSMVSQSDMTSEDSIDPDDVMDDGESISIMDQGIVGSFIEDENIMELIDQPSANFHLSSLNKTSGTLVKVKTEGLISYDSPLKQHFLPCDDWISTLQATVSPRKKNRALLKSLIQSQDELEQYNTEQQASPTLAKSKFISDGRGFSTSIDLMNSLFGQTSSPVKSYKVSNKVGESEWQRTKRSEISDKDNLQTADKESLFHNSMKPRWGPDGTLIYAAPLLGKGSQIKNDLLVGLRREIVSEHRDVRFAKFSNEASTDLLKKHKEITVIDDTNHVPQAVLSENLGFTDFFDDNAPNYEKLVWQLASILWDPIDVPKELCEMPHIESRIRKSNLSKFWEKIVDDASSRQVALARSHEEKAIACLSGHKIDDACTNLVSAGNMRLSTLIALIGSKDSIKSDMQAQLDAWRKSQMLSEMTQSIRALYELLAGNVCVCDEVKGPPEDRVESFSISKRFGLNWRQAFGLRLWYAIAVDEPIEIAVECFANDLSTSKEESWPSPWYIEQKVPELWQDPCANERQDLLWGILKLSTFEDSDLEDVLRPENSQLSPMDIRLSWQLSQAILSLGSIKFTSDDDIKSDQTTLSFASQLVNEGNWLDATFVLLHLSSPVARLMAIKDNLGRNAGHIGTVNCPNFKTLTQNFKIPAAWIWEAKALYKRSVEKDPRSEVECLIKAGSFNEAHQTFSRMVAPKAIVELDYKSLSTLLKDFEGKDKIIGDWPYGGGLYGDFLTLVESQEKSSYPEDDLVLERLLYGLPSVAEESRHPNFIESVAVQSMSDVVAKTVLSLAKNGMVSLSSIFQPRSDQILNQACMLTLIPL
ncbi:hypothetical protein EPUL_002226 [Erysiphe pulchra]|uniref:Peptidase S59 domain-containing protein n=1 Tax=Erysiphe pulchra TaxID=225359 RepID=A0A2S4PV48_9PEZI|nr:hypothetical protein EPUL_002226 [Erysiphe pulchra]